MNSLTPSVFGIQSTAGAIPVRNDKGEVSMKKVKVHRYVSGKRPDYAPISSSDEDSDSDGFIEQQQQKNQKPPPKPLSPKREEIDSEVEIGRDPRLRRLIKTKVKHSSEESDTENRIERHRHIHEPEIIEQVESEEDRKDDDSEEDEGDLSDEEIERRRQLLRQKLLCKKETEELEVLDKEEENKSAESEEESSEYEEYTDSEEETGPRLKPVFVRKKDRITVIEKEKEAQKQKQAELESKRMAEERRRHTLKMIEEDIRKEAALKAGDEPKLADVNTDDENDEVEYEAWKLRELKRIKRDREEREALEKERSELERIRNMTEEERRLELRNNPKVITNKASKGKYKFLQKYYHRGVFYLDNEEDVFKRDFSQATLEDHFDKTILPKVMQVKNFGRSGRTKYTHLVDQDTTQLDSPWASDTAQNLKFYNNQAAGMKQAFDKPTKIFSKKRSK